MLAFFMDLTPHLYSCCHSSLSYTLLVFYCQEETFERSAEVPSFHFDHVPFESSAHQLIVVSGRPSDGSGERRKRLWGTYFFVSLRSTVTFTFLTILFCRHRIVAVAVDFNKQP